MSAFIRSFIAVLLLPAAAFAATVRGVVRDVAGAPLPGVTVAIDRGPSATTRADGAFTLDVEGERHVLRVSKPGYQSDSREVSAGTPVELNLRPAIAESIVVSGIRAEELTPVTKTEITRAEIERAYHGQDIPLLLQEAPSINAYAESGAGGSGYSYISLRGVTSNRINFTLDGVPLADSEDFGTYFADFPDLARSLQSVQIQRGVGTSTVGSPSFGGSVNLESIDLWGTPSTTATLAGGSFGNRQASVGYHSGQLPGDVALYARVSYLENEGFRESSAMRQRNLFFSGAKQVGEGQLKLTGFTGHEDQQSSYYATDEETLRTNLRANPMRPEEKDGFGYDLAHLQYIRPIGSDSNMTASAYYQRGYGYFRLFRSGSEQLRDYGLDGKLLGTFVTYSHAAGPLTTNYGVHVNRFVRDHTRTNITLHHRDYANYGVKGEANAFAKVNYLSGAWNLYADAQVRHSTFDYHGTVSVPGISWTFFNPKVGARYSVAPSSSVYVSAGISSREPTRNDMFNGADELPVALDLHATRPERLLDLEAGWNYRVANVDLAANVYAMEFRNEIAATGEQSEIGLTLRRNVGRSYRRGVELDASWQTTPALRLRTSAALSRNRISSWTQFFDVYDAAGEWAGAKPVAYRDVNPLLTPAVILNQAIEYTPSSLVSAGLLGRYVSKSYLDNTNNDAFVTPSFFVADANVSLSLARWIKAGAPRLSLQVNNLFDNDRVYASGYSYEYFNRAAGGAESLSGTSYYYPQATRNVVVTLDVKIQ